MIVSNDRELKHEIELITCINRKLGGSLVKDMLGSIFSASPYIEDIKDDIATIAYNISEDQCFSDGNKRTALTYIVLKSSDYKLRLKIDDSRMYDLFMNFIMRKISKEVFIENLWY